MMNIVTSICVDENEQDHYIKYPSTLDASSNQRRIIYWKCVTVFFATSIRCNPKAKHILYTNDQQPLIIKGLDLVKFLTDLGVEIRYMPFQYFKPPAGYSDAFKNAFYKLDVIKALGVENGTYSILLDSDCVWTKPNEKLNKLIQSDDAILLYDVYQSFKGTKDSHYQTRLNLGKLYKEIDPDYSKTEPTQFGGEFIAGSSANFRIITELLQSVYNLILSKYTDHPPKVNEKSSIFDGDEFLASYVYNNMPIRYINAKEYIARIWNTLRYSIASEKDMDLTIWHMPSEKTQGFPLLFKEIINKNSLFWKFPIENFNHYLGKYLGVPKHIVPERYLMLSHRLFEAAFRKIRQ